MTASYLVNVHVEISIEANGRGVGPEDTRVLDETSCLESVRVIHIDSVLSGHELVDESIGITLEAIGISTSLSMVRDIAVSSELSKRVAVPCTQVDTRNRVEVVRRQRTVVDTRSVRGELDAVETFLLVTDGHAKLVEVARPRHV